MALSLPKQKIRILLLEGVNDLDGSGEAAAPAALDAIRSMIRDAQHRGVKVIVATLLPQVPPLERAFAPGLIAPHRKQAGFALSASSGKRA